jgi:hypothetical protein
MDCDLTFWVCWGCKPGSPEFPSSQFQHGHERIQVDDLANALKVQCPFSSMCRQAVGDMLAMLCRS